MKLQIELTENQLGILIDALESRFRWMMPQQSDLAIDSLLNDVAPKKNNYSNEVWSREFDRWIERREHAGEVASTLQRIIYGRPYEDKYPSHRNISDMWRVLRHTQWEMLDEKFDFDVRECEPIQLGSEPLMKVEVIEK